MYVCMYVYFIPEHAGYVDRAVFPLMAAEKRERQAKVKENGCMCGRTYCLKLYCRCFRVFMPCRLASPPDAFGRPWGMSLPLRMRVCMYAFIVCVCVCVCVYVML